MTTGRVPVELPLARSNPIDPPTELRALRDDSPLVPTRFPDGHVGWLVTSHRLVRAVLADPRFSVRRELLHVPVGDGRAQQPLTPAEPGIFPHLDPPAHTAYRTLLRPHFGLRRVQRLEARIREVTGRVLDRMAVAGQPVDLVTAFALPIPTLVICELLGMPPEDSEVVQAAAVTMNDLGAAPERVAAAVGTVVGAMRALVESRRKEPHADLLTEIVHAGDLTDEAAANVAMVLLITGHVPVSSMLALGALTLLSRPDPPAAEFADPARAATAVEELLRYLSILQFDVRRAALEDVQLDGHTIRAGDTVILSLPAANRDPAFVTEPELLDLGRSAAGHLAFGHGVHHCLGQHLARAELRIGYTALFRRFPDLRLAIPVEQVTTRDRAAVYGVDELPVAWGGRDGGPSGR